jgi:nucleoside-diphosphate-sugar epimerase
MDALVIGGTRFVGLSLVHELYRQGHSVATLNRGKMQARLPEGVSRLYADRRDPETVKKALDGTRFDWVFDCTGYQLINVEPMVNLFHDHIKRYVFVSTSGVYAATDIMPISEDFPLQSADTNAEGVTGYGAEKVQCEDFLRSAYLELGFPAVIVRPGIVYGPHNWMDDREGSYFARLLRGRKILIPGHGMALMHVVYVDDLAKILIIAAGNDSASGQAYNALGPHAITFTGWIDLVMQTVGINTEKVHLPESVLMDIAKQGRSPVSFTSPNRSEVFSMEKAKKDLDFTPQYDLIVGLSNTYEWWQAERGLENIDIASGRLGHNVDLKYEDELIGRFEAGGASVSI